MQQRCPEPCVTDGIPLQWRSRYLHYTFDERGFPGLSDAEQRAIFAEAFGAWESVQCGDEPVGFHIYAEEATTEDSVGPESRFPEWNINTIVLFTQAEWDDHDLPLGAFAVTGVWYLPSTGQLVGADMQFNGAMSTFGVCPDDGCPSGIVDLRNVATHEAGHFLGLAHSQLRDSTMWCGADSGDLTKRDLGQDDIEGLCAAYPPGQARLVGPPSVASTGCSLTGRERRPHGVLWIAIAVVISMRRRTRSASGRVRKNMRVT